MWHFSDDRTPPLYLEWVDFILRSTGATSKLTPWSPCWQQMNGALKTGILFLFSSSLTQKEVECEDRGSCRRNAWLGVIC